MIVRQGNQVNAIDEEMNTVTDNTTNALYLYVSENLSPSAATTDATWRCYRVTLSNARVSWADGVSTFTKQASLAATYTYAT